jgi:peptidoglycan/LPS O-acetylase OafA/YrhL
VYHLSPHRLPSGFLGVDVFMVVSGYLITALLLAEQQRHGRVSLARFWGRRFRRLIPALMVVLAAVALFVHVEGPRLIVPSVRAQGIAALFYASNWRLVADSVTYGGAVGARSPLVHLWSLAVEEQFYLVWPCALVVLFAVGRGRRRVGFALAAIGAVASAVLMAVHYHPGHDPSRLYYGTDTRAQAFLIGALAAFVAPYVVGGVRRLISVVALPALVGLLVFMCGQWTGVLYRGGFMLVALVTGLIVLGTLGSGITARWLAHAPLRGVGRISYGVYLWHWPAITLLTRERVGVGGFQLTLLQLGITMAGAVASWFIVERPIARLRPAAVAAAGIATMIVAAIAVATLPTENLVAYADARTGRVPKPVVVEPVAGASRGTAMIVGDSGMYDATPALAAGLRRAGYRVVEFAFPGAGLTQPAGVRSAWAAATRTYNVDLTIVMLGRWDADWIDAHGHAAYRAVIDDAVLGLAGSGGRVLWLSELPGGLGTATKVNPFYVGLPARDRGVVDYLDIAPVLRARNGDAGRVVDGRLLRKPDEWHLCPDGAAAVAHAVLQRVGVDNPAWDGGSWRADARYDDPHGGCRPV